MSHNYILSEKKETTHSTLDTFEEVFTDLDVAKDAEYDPAVGYPFRYPSRWLEDHSQNKKIALRRIEVSPPSGAIKLNIKYTVPRLETKTFTSTRNINFNCNQNLFEVLDMLCETLTYYSPNRNKNSYLDYKYDKNTHKLTFMYKWKNTSNTYENIPFGFYGTDDECDPLLRLLNQPITAENRNKLLCITEKEISFDNVWDRDRLFFHSSFSTANRRLLGVNGDFYHNLNHLYPPPTNESSFNIYFTTDGRRPILLHHCMFRIQLVFIVNYLDSLAF